MDQGRKERIARNEAAYRDLNEAIGTGPGRGALQLLCECGREDCTGPIYVAPDDYSVVRASPRRFLVLPGHEILEAERVVEERPGYRVVEKPDDVAHIVDPAGAGAG